MSDIPIGLCQCGCGQKTNIADKTRPKRGHIKGQPYRFLLGHLTQEIRNKLAESVRGENNHRWCGGKRIDSQGYVQILTPNHPRADRFGYVPEHILKAERALGHAIPIGVETHHHPFNPSDSLIICQDRKYHRLLHRRYQALKNCGHANWRKCWICKKYDDPNNVSIRPNYAPYHKYCMHQYNKKRKIKLH